MYQAQPDPICRAPDLAVAVRPSRQMRRGVQGADAQADAEANGFQASTGAPQNPSGGYRRPSVSNNDPAGQRRAPGNRRRAQGDACHDDHAGPAGDLVIINKAGIQRGRNVAAAQGPQGEDRHRAGRRRAIDVQRDMTFASRRARRARIWRRCARRSEGSAERCKPSVRRMERKSVIVVFRFAGPDRLQVRSKEIAVTGHRESFHWCVRSRDQSKRRVLVVPCLREAVYRYERLFDCQRLSAVARIALAYLGSPTF